MSGFIAGILVVAFTATLGVNSITSLRPERALGGPIALPGNAQLHRDFGTALADTVRRDTTWRDSTWRDTTWRDTTGQDSTPKPKPPKKRPPEKR